MELESIKKALQSKKITTPAYIFDLDVLSNHLSRIKEIVGENIGLCYAMKANPLLVSTINGHIGKIEVCSPGELEICKRNRIPGKNIIFSGVNKTKQDIDDALSYEVSVITIESEKHLKLVRDYCTHHNVVVHVLLRLTSGAQFGMDESIVENIIEHRNKYPDIIIDGIHFFSGTQKKKIEKMEEELQYLNHFIKRLEDKFQFRTLQLEYGAGLAVPYFEGERFEEVYQNLEELIHKINDIRICDSITLELGRYFTWFCGQYLTRVEDIKCNNGHAYAIVDGGIHQLNYYGQNMAMRVPQIHLIKGMDVVEMKESTLVSSNEWTICGSLCTFADVLVRKWTGSVLAIGDYLSFENVGSYSVTEAPALFLSRRLPTIYDWSQKEGLKCVRSNKEAYEWNCSVGE